jgi:flagellar operon protein
MAGPINIDIKERLIAPQGPHLRPGGSSPQTQAANGPSFADLLRQAQSTGQAGGLKFSAHAQTRIQSRQIQLGPAEMERVQNAVQKAAGKGSKESLVLLDQTALVVSVPNRTVITVVDKDNLKQNVFTNIDSAVIA